MRWMFVLLSAWTVAGCGAPPAQPHPVVTTHTHTVAPLLRTQCIDCHEGPEAEAGFDITPLLAQGAATPESTLERADQWERVAWMVEQGAMPPEGMPPLTPDQRQSVTTWVDAAVSHAEAVLPEVVGALTVRRLNRAEFAATVKDLLGIDVDTQSQLPPDDAGHGFDHLGEVLTVSPTHLEAYLRVARDIAAQAIVDVSPDNPIAHAFGGDQLRGAGRGRRYQGGWMFSSRGHVRAHAQIARGGVYRITVRAWGQQAGPDVAKMKVRVLESRSPAATVEVPAVRGAAGNYTVQMKLPRGTARVEAAFLNDYWDPNHKDPRKRDRNLMIESIRVDGPLRQDLEPLPPKTRQLTARAQGDRNATGLLRIARWLVPRAWRRPVPDDELGPMVALADATRARRGFGAGVQRLIEATLLLSSYFLFRVEEGVPSSDASRSDRALTPHELASRLSYFLWGTMPDAALRAHADNGTLHASLRAEIARLLADKRSDVLIERFAFQWLSLPRLARMTPDPKRFPSYTPALRASMLEETRRVLRDVFRNGIDIRGLLDARFTWLDASLAKHYGLDRAYRAAPQGLDGTAWRAVALPTSDRGGILGHASLLTVTSYPTRTSPVQRGHYVLDTLLGRAPPPAPPGVASLDEDETNQRAGPARTVRERLEQHRSDPTCAACHNTMDALGFGLESYDAIGRWRTNDRGRPLDTQGVLPDGRTFEGPAAMRALLRDDPAFVRTFAEQLLTYALGRGLTRRDGPTIRAILAHAAHRGRTLEAFVHAIIVSRPFQRLAHPEAHE